ncbi:hypothetical protein C8J57DRAFT_1526207 [Mycena rebaudengoi]|nr:hypothetical protein C8J57DRAFT_1526207 [Mycena rebaudengoi]
MTSAASFAPCVTIANGMNPSLFLSYPGAPFGATPDFAGTVVYSKLPTVFSLQALFPPLSGVRIVESKSQTVLTAWQVVPGILQTPVHTHISVS